MQLDDFLPGCRIAGNAAANERCGVFAIVVPLFELRLQPRLLGVCIPPAHGQ
jgi:hypothetical protein